MAAPSPVPELNSAHQAAMMTSVGLAFSMATFDPLPRSRVLYILTERGIIASLFFRLVDCFLVPLLITGVIDMATAVCALLSAADRQSNQRSF